MAALFGGCVQVRQAEYYVFGKREENSGLGKESFCVPVRKGKFEKNFEFKGDPWIGERAGKGLPQESARLNYYSGWIPGHEAKGSRVHGQSSHTGALPIQKREKVAILN